MSQTQRADLEREFAELLEQTDRNRREAIGERALCWLALLPEWSLALAEACRFPAEPEPLERMLEQAERAGLCKVRRGAVAVDGSKVRFWMRSSTRAWLFEQWQEWGGPDLRVEIEEIASRIRDIHQGGRLEISPGVLRWAELALGELEAQLLAGEVLLERVRKALDEGDTSTAGEWIFAAGKLAAPLGAEMKLATARAQRLLNLHYRRLQDERYVAEFVKREEQIREIRELVASEDVWAVHFIGQSGVGKTMLMRYLTGRLPDPDPYTFSARVDFDYLDPRFPLEAPARLLHELGEGLAANLADADQEAKYRSFREAVTRTEAGESSFAGLDPLATPEFEEVIATFASFVRSLPQPVVLILDTCEELAKLHPAGEDIPTIRAMFTILNRVHEAAPSVRVVLAGRRWLTKQAANKVRGLAMPPAVEKMEPRTYMRMHAVRGFTRDEAIEFLCKAHGLDLDDEMIEAILELTFDPGAPPSLDRDALGPLEEPRYSPSDVALFAGWIEREPDLKPAELAKGNRDDPYVEVRIFEKIESSEVLAAIPAVALLERFDQETIRPALEGDGAAKSRAIDGLIEQEWTHLEDGAGPDEMVISIDSGLLRRLTSYFDATPERRRQREDAREALNPHLTEMFERPTDEVPPDRIDSAVRALPIEDTLRLLETMEERVVGEPAWPWAEAVGSFLLSQEREPLLPRELAAAVRALYVAALTHRRSSADIEEQWRAVIEAASAHPDTDRASALRIRGRLGVLAAAAANGGYDAIPAGEDLVEGRRMLHRRALADAVGPGLLAAIEAIVDACEERGYPMPATAVREGLAALLEHFKEEEPVWAYVLALEGRMRTLIGEWDTARESFERLEDLSTDAMHGEPRFADWVPPGSIGHRTLLEALRFRLADGSEHPELIDRCERAALERPGGADGAQLLSLVLQARLASGGLTREALEEVAGLELALQGYEATAPAQRVTPPLFVSLAEAWLAVGRPARGLDLLAEREQIAAVRRIDEDSTGAAALATVRIVRVLRSSGRLGLIGGFASSDEDNLRAEALAAGALIAGLRPPPSLEIEGDHAAWRARNLLNPREEVEALRAMRWASASPAGGSASLHIALDRLEAAQVRLRWSGVGRFERWRATRAVKRLAAARHSSPSISEPLRDEDLRLQLRLGAMLGEGSWPVEPNRLRQVGRLALKEGELLALRLPDRAAPMLRFSGQCLERAGHPHGAFFAALRAAIAEIHAGEPAAARARRETIVERYAQLREREPAIPTVESLLASDPTSDPAGSADVYPGWTQRLGAYLRWCEGIDREGGGESASLSTEPELSLLPAAGAAGTGVPFGALSGSRRAALFALAGFTTLVVAIGVFLGRSLGGDPAVAIGLSVGALVVLLVSTVVVEAVVGSVPLLARLPVEGFDISIAPRPSRSKRVQIAKARVDPWARRPLVDAYFRLWRLFRPQSRWDALIVPGNNAAAEPPSGPLGLAVKPRARGGFTAIRLAITPDLARLAWERRLVGHLTQRPDWEPRSAPPIWRVRPPGYFAAPCPALPLPIADVVSPEWRPFVQSVAATNVAWTSGEDEEPARAALTLGFPVFTRAGWRLRLDDEPIVSAGEARRHGQRLLSPDGLVRRAPIAVVVGRPAGLGLVSDQRIAEGLRGFANETFLAGAYAVIAVPALPPERTAEAISLLTHEIAAWYAGPEAEPLLELVARLRCLLFKPLAGADAGTVPDPERRERERLLRAELALDVCLFGPR